MDVGSLRKALLLGVRSVGHVAVLWWAVGCAQADNPPEGNSTLPGVSFAQVTAESAGQRVGIPGNGLAPFRTACDQRHPLWLLGSDKPFVCDEPSTSTDAMLDLPTNDLGAFTVSDSSFLVGTRRIRAVPLEERDGALEDSLRAVLPAAYRSAKHSARAAWGDTTLVFLPGATYRPPEAGCIALRTAVVSVQASHATLLGELKTMPRTLVRIEGQAEPFAWGNVGCIGESLSILWRIAPALPAVATYVTGVENDLSPEDAAAAVRDDEERRHGPGVIQCERADGATEAVICAHPELMEWDQRIAETFVQLRSSYKDDDLTDFVDGQKLWLIERNDCHNKPTWQPYAEGEFGCLWTSMNRRASRLADLALHRTTLAETTADYHFVNPAYLTRHAKAYAGKYVGVFGTLDMDECGRSPLGRIHWQSADVRVRTTEPGKESCTRATAYWKGTVSDEAGTLYLRR